MPKKLFRNLDQKYLALKLITFSSSPQSDEANCQASVSGIETIQVRDAISANITDKKYAERLGELHKANKAFHRQTGESREGVSLFFKWLNHGKEALEWDTEVMILGF